MSTHTVNDILATFQKADKIARTNPDRAAAMTHNHYQRLVRKLGPEQARALWFQALSIGPSTRTTTRPTA